MFTAYLSLILAVQFAIIAFVFFLKKQSHKANMLLGMVMAIIAFQHFAHYIWASHKAYDYPWLLNLDLPLDGLMAPLLLFYIRTLIGEPIKWHPRLLLHFWPLLPGAIWYTIFNLQTQQQQFNFIDHVYSDVPLAAVILTVQIVIYLGIGYRDLDRHIKSQTNTQWSSGYSNLEWLRQLIAIMFVLTLCMAPANFIAKFSYIITGFQFFTSFIILFVFYKAVNHPEVLNSELIRKITQQLEYQHELEKVRSRIGQDIHDELGAGLTRISMLGEITKMQHKGDSELTAKMQNVVDIAHELSGNLREVVWAVNPAHDNLNSLLVFIRHYAGSFFEPTDIQLRIDFPEEAENISLQPYVRRNIILVVKEALNNIVKHANATQVNIKVEVSGDNISLSISDNGTGITKNNSILSNGMQSMQKRTEEVGGKFVVMDTLGQGYGINIKVPLRA